MVTLMELLEGKRKEKKLILSILIIMFFLIQIVLMLYEYFNYNGFDLLSEFNFVKCNFLICKGDTTTWFHPPLRINYVMYCIIAALATCITGYEYMLTKKKNTIFLLMLWSIMLLINFLSIIILRSQAYGLSLMIFHEMFISMQFLNINYGIVSWILGSIFVIFITIHIIYIVSFFLKMMRDVDR